MVTEEVVKDRNYYNMLILNKLTEYLKSNPQLRFHQALQNLGINERAQGDRFFEESVETYESLRK